MCVCVFVLIQVDYFKRITLRDEIFRPMQVCARVGVDLRLLLCVCERACVSLCKYKHVKRIYVHMYICMYIYIYMYIYII